MKKYYLDIARKASYFVGGVLLALDERLGPVYATGILMLERGVKRFKGFGDDALSEEPETNQRNINPGGLGDLVEGEQI